MPNPSPNVIPNRTSRKFEITAGALEYRIPNSEYYSNYVFQFEGADTGTVVKIQGKARAQATVYEDLSVLDTARYSGNVTGAAGLIAVVLPVSLAGGVNFLASASTGTTTVYVTMSRKGY